MSIKTLAGISAAAILSILAGKAYAADAYAHFPFEGNGNNTVEGSPIAVGSEGSNAANNYITVRGGGDSENKALVTTASVHPHANGSSVFGTGDGTTVTLAASIQSVATANSTLMMIGNSNTPNVLGLFSDGTAGVYVGEITGDSITRLITASVDTATTKLHHYVVSYDKGETKSVALYVDGVKVVDDGAVAPTVEPGGSWQLGAPYGGAKKGALVASGTVIEDFQTFTSILSDEEVTALAATFPSTSTAPILSQFAPEAGVTTWEALTGGAELGNMVEITLSGDTTITLGGAVNIANLVIKGTGNLIISDRDNLTFGSLTTTGWADRIMTTKTLDGNGFTVPANTAVIITGSEGEADPIAAGAITVPAGAGLITHGNIAMTLTNNGTVDIADGVVNVTRGEQQAIKGTVNIASGAVFNNESNDAVAWNGGTTINVRGTLNMGNHRWTVGGSSTLNLFGGCTVTGTTTGEGSIDLYRANNVITVAKGADDSITDVVIDAKIRVRNDDARISIANGMTLGITGGIGMSAGEGTGLSIVGGGKLSGTIPLMGITLNLGTGQANLPARFVSESGTNTIKWEGGVNNGNAQICSDDTKDDPFVTIKSGTTLKINGKDFSGWAGALSDHGWVKNDGTLVFAEGTGSRFWRDHIVLGNGSNIKIDNGDRNVLLYGGAGTADNCQIMLASGSATIEPGTTPEGGVAVKGLYLGNDGQGTYGTHGAGISVGDNATLTVSVPLAGGDAITKHGAGTLKFTDATSTYTGTITVADGGVVVPAGFTGTVTGHTVYAELSDGSKVYGKSTKVCSHAEADWAGKLVIIGDLTGAANFGNNSDIFGGATEIEISADATVTGHLPDDKRTCNLTIGGTLSLNNGYTGKPTTIPVLKGSGSIVKTWTGTPTVYVEDHSGWTGTADACITFSVAKIEGETTTYYYTLADAITAATDDALDTIIVIDPTAALPEGYEIVEGTVVKKSSPAPTAITNGSQEQQTAYAEWATANGVSGSTTSELADAFAVLPNTTGCEDEEAVLDAAEKELVKILATLDLTKITTEAFPLEAYPNATFKFVAAEVTGVDTDTTHLFRLSVEFKAVPAAE